MTRKTIRDGESMVMDDDSRPAGGVEEICRTGAGQTGEGEGEGGGEWSDHNLLGIGHQRTIGIAKVIGHGQIHTADVSREGATSRGDKGWGMDGPTIRSNTARSDRSTEISLKEGQALNRTDRRAGQLRGKALIGDNEDIGHNLDSAQDARRKVEAPQHTCAPQHTLPKVLPRPLHADSAVAIARVQEQQVPENEEFFVRFGLLVPSVPTLAVTLNSSFPEEDRVSDPVFLSHSVVSSNRRKSVPVPIPTSSPSATSLASAASRSFTGTPSIRPRVYSPYQIPLSSSRSTMDSMRTPIQRPISAFPPTVSPENDYEPTTPPRHDSSSAKTQRHIYHSPGIGRIASPAGSMSTGSRRCRPPAWPTSARRVSDAAAAEANAAAEVGRAGISHREMLARSAGLAQREGGQGAGIISPTSIPPISGFTSTQSRPVPLSAGRAIPHGYVVMRNASGERYNHPVYRLPSGQVGKNGLLAQPLPSSGPQRSPGLLGPRGPLTPVYSPISPNRPPRGHPYYPLVSPMPTGSYPYRPIPVQHGSQVPVMVPIARHGLSPGYPISPPYLPQNRSLHSHPVQLQHTHPSHSAQPGSARAAGFSASAPVQNGQLPPLSPTVKNEIYITPRGTVKYTPVSQAWAISGLNKRARWDWYKPETTDCWVVCPIWSVLNKRQEARAKAKAEQAAMEAAGSVTSEPAPADGKTSEMHIDHGADSGVSDKKATDGFKEGDDIMSAQRQVNGKESQRDQIPVIMIPLHREYLLTQVKLFRYLLNEHEKTKDIDDDDDSTSPRPPTDSRAERVTRRRLIEFEGDPDPTQDLPQGLMRESKCLPVPKGDKPVLYCPIPDPGAFGIIVRYLYWGDLREVEDALSRGIVSWQGLVYNIDFLDLDDGIKRCVGNWWRKWIKTETQSTTGRNVEDSSDDDDEGTRRGAKNVKSSPRGSRRRRSKSLVEPGSGVESDGCEGDNEGEEDEGPRKPKGPSPAKRDGMEVDEGVDEAPRRGRGKRVPGLATPSGSGVGSKAEDKAKRWVRGDGEVDEGVVGRLRNL